MQGASFDFPFYNNEPNFFILEGNLDENERTGSKNWKNNLI